METKTFCFVIFVTVFIIFVESRIQPPSFKTILTEKGLNFLSKATENDFLPSGKGKKSSSPLVSTIFKKEKFLIDNIHYQILRFKFSNDGQKPISTLKFYSKIGFNHNIQNMNLTVDAKYYTETNSSGGYMSLSLNNISVWSVISLINDDGRLKPIVNQCRSTIGSLDLQFVESNSDFDMSSRISKANDVLKSTLQDELCRFENRSYIESLSKKFVDPSTNDILLDKYSFDESLMESPDVQDSYMETNHRGTISVLNEITSVNDSLPFQPSTLVSANFNESYDLKMVYVFMSNYSLNSLLYYLWKSDQLNYNFSRSTIKNSAQEGYLRTDCDDNGGLCASILLPGLKRNFPNGSLEVTMKATSRPNVVIHQGNVTVTTNGYLECTVDVGNGSKIFLFSLNADLNIIIRKFQLSDYSSDIRLGEFKLTNFTSSQPDIDVGSVTMLLTLAKDMFFEGDLSDLFKRAALIPKLLNFDVDATDSEVLFIDDLFYMSFNYCESKCERSPNDDDADAK